MEKKTVVFWLIGAVLLAFVLSGYSVFFSAEYGLARGQYACLVQANSADTQLMAEVEKNGNRKETLGQLMRFGTLFCAFAAGGLTVLLVLRKTDS